MAKVKLTLTCSECGNEFIHTHYVNNRTSAESYEDWARENITVCPDCYRNAIKANERATRDEEVKHGRLKIAEIGLELPPLTGTEKQVAWADSIRTRAVGIFADAGAKEKAWDLIKSKTEAKFWIDIRDYVTTNGHPAGIAKTIIKQIIGDGV